MRTKLAMAAQFTEVTLEEMERFLKRGWRALRPKQGKDRGEIYYDLALSPHVVIRVWTSIGAGRDVGAEIGSDAIRIQLFAKTANRPLLKGKAPIVKRTQNWKTNLQDRIEDVIEMYEEKEAYFEGRAGGTPPKTPDNSWSDGREVSEQDELERKKEWAQPNEDSEDETPAPVAPSRRNLDLRGTFTKLRSGDWGVRILGDASPGDKIRTERKDGSIQWVTAGDVMWKGVERGEQITVTTIAKSPRTAEEQPKKEGPTSNQVRIAMSYLQDFSHEEWVSNQFDHKFKLAHVPTETDVRRMSRTRVKQLNESIRLFELEDDLRQR